MPTRCASTRCTAAERFRRVSTTSLAASRGGFTLLEVLVAVAVLATALVSLLSLHGKNIQTVAYDQQLSRATLLAQDLMTRTLVTEPFPDPTRNSGAFAHDPEHRWEVAVL